MGIIGRLVVLMSFIIGLSDRISAIEIKDINSDFSRFSTDNYTLLREAHINAIDNGLPISYKGIDTIRLVVPKDSRSIPLPKEIDFDNVVFLIRNNSKNCYLFEYSNQLAPISIDKGLLHKGAKIAHKELEGKKILLVVEDKNPWVAERKGYKSPHIRRDVLLINDGTVINSPIRTYNNEYSYPECSYCDISGDSLIVSNLGFFRTEDSTHKTFCLKVLNAANIRLDNLTIETPESEIYGDAIFSFANCADLTLTNLCVNRTYSHIDKYGYAISMNNVFNSCFKNIYAAGEWGIFGNNNINKVNIADCNINRFDIHCYGKDVACTNTIFRNLYNQFSSFYGELLYIGCMFYHFTPVTIDGSYSAYTSFDVRFEDCCFELDFKRPYIFNMTHSKFLIDSIRPELGKMEWPNLFMQNVNIICPANLPVFYLYHTYKNAIVNLAEFPKVMTDNVVFDSNKVKFSNSEPRYSE